MGERRNRKDKWTFQDLIDLEGQRWLDRELDAEALERRDREWYREADPDGGTDASPLLRWWLRDQIQNRPVAPSPGQVFDRACAALSVVGSLLALISGISACYWTLRYDGSIPVNVSVFLGLLVAPQLLLLLGLVPVALLGSVRSSLLTTLYAIPSAWVRALLGWLWKRPWLQGKLSGSQRDQARIAGGEIQDLLRQHGGLVTNRVFGILQLAGVTFNLGVLVCMMLLLLFTDRAFGWQSSLVGSPAQVHELVQTLALPWRAFVAEGIANPTLDQIMGSRIVLRESGAALASPDLLAWWPFLLLCVIFYGLLPRVLTWLLSRWIETRMLRSMRFEGFEYASMIERMKSVEYCMHGVPSDGRHPAHEGDGRQGLEPVPADPTQPVNVWVLRESVARYGEPMIHAWLRELAGGTVRELQTLERLDGLQSVQFDGEARQWLLLEGWQPPIQEVLHHLSTVAQHLQLSEQSLVLLLLGKPGPEGVRPLPESMREVWKRKIRLLAQPNLRIVDQPQPAAQS